MLSTAAPTTPWDSACTFEYPPREGVMVATGAAPLVWDSDVGGSIRIPAAFCGTVGHKPTGGLVLQNASALS